MFRIALAAAALSLVALAGAVFAAAAQMLSIERIHQDGSVDCNPDDIGLGSSVRTT